MWVHNSALAKSIVFPHKIKVENSQQIISYKRIKNYCRNNRKFAPFVTLHNRIQTVRISHQNSQKFGISSKCHFNCSSNKRKLLLRKTSRAAINYCEEDTSSVTNTHLLLFKRTIVFTGVKVPTDITTYKYKTNKLFP